VVNADWLYAQQPAASGWLPSSGGMATCLMCNCCYTAVLCMLCFKGHRNNTHKSAHLWQYELKIMTTSKQDIHLFHIGMVFSSTACCDDLNDGILLGAAYCCTAGS
jgi:hypothetical protein